MKWGFKGTKELEREILETAFSRAVAHPRISERLKEFPNIDIRLSGGKVIWKARTIDCWDYGEIRWGISAIYKGKEFGTGGWVQPYHGTAEDDIAAIKERWIRDTMWQMIARLEDLLDYIKRLEEQGEL